MELQDYNCVLCYQTTEESVFHLLLGCPFATACWNWVYRYLIKQSLALPLYIVFVVF